VFVRASSACYPVDRQDASRQIEGRPVDNFSAVWRRACEAVGLEGRLFHDLRRSAARNMDRAGVSRHVAMQITGHKTEAMYRRYNIVNDADVKAALEKTAATAKAEIPRILLSWRWDLGISGGR
jgi:integrase